MASCGCRQRSRRFVPVIPPPPPLPETHPFVTEQLETMLDQA